MTKEQYQKNTKVSAIKTQH